MIYHKDVNMPKRIRGLVPTGTKSLLYSKHAQGAFADKYGEIVPPANMCFAEAAIVEVTEFNGVIDKLVLRKQYDEKTDLVLVLLPCTTKEKWFVKTVWLNEHGDDHATLNTNRFAKRKFG